MLVQSVVQRDLPLAQGAVLVIAVVYVVVNILTDLVQAWLDQGSTSHEACSRVPDQVALAGHVPCAKAHGNRVDG